MELQLFPRRGDQCPGPLGLPRSKHSIYFHHYSPHPASLVPLFYFPGPSPIFPSHIWPSLRDPLCSLSLTIPALSYHELSNPFLGLHKTPEGTKTHSWSDPSLCMQQLCLPFLSRIFSSRKWMCVCGFLGPSFFSAFVPSFASSWRTVHSPAASKCLLVYRPQLIQAA
jgi:hypothetical protein